MSKRLLSTSVKEGLKQSDQDQECGSKIFYVQKASYLKIGSIIAVSVRYSSIILTTIIYLLGSKLTKQEKQAKIQREKTPAGKVIQLCSSKYTCSFFYNTHSFVYRYRQNVEIFS